MLINREKIVELLMMCGSSQPYCEKIWFSEKIIYKFIIDGDNILLNYYYIIMNFDRYTFEEAYDYISKKYSYKLRKHKIKNLLSWKMKYLN